MKKLIAIIIISASLLSLCSCGISEEKAGISVVTTCFPLYEFAREIVGDVGSVTLLLKPGQDAHSYDPTAKEIQKIKSCSLFLSIGGEDEKWVSTLFSGGELKSVPRLSLIESIKGHVAHDGHSHERDEHIWTSPKNAIIMTEVIRDKLIILCPEHKDLFESNASAYISKLKELDNGFEALSDISAEKPIVFGDRFPFTHLFEDYGIPYVSVYPGCSEMTEPSASDVAEIIGIIKNRGINTVFVTQLSNGKVADAVCTETGAKKAVLHSCANITKADKENGETYISLMTNNLNALKTALER